jgi:hypothetical protein
MTVETQFKPQRFEPWKVGFETYLLNHYTVVIWTTKIQSWIMTFLNHKNYDLEPVFIHLNSGRLDRKKPIQNLDLLGFFQSNY